MHFAEDKTITEKQYKVFQNSGVNRCITFSVCFLWWQKLSFEDIELLS